MKYLLALLALFTGTFTSAQSIDISGTTTRAVVIGISDYQDKDIPDLRFADRDAEAFAVWLRSPAGGSVSEKNIVLLTNKQATIAQFAKALDGLMETAKEGDQVIIYFSGHGDVETKTLRQNGFLLCHDSPAATYMAGAYALTFLQDVVTTLNQQNKAKVTVITDACRAGKLAGSSINGAQLTSANLAKQFADEVKILSCQPNEFSLEGEQWGGGRGVFSFHLLDGLTGMADKNGDGSVNLFELGHYLDDRVPTEAAPHSQLPLTVGDRQAMLATVDAQTLADLRSAKSTLDATLKGTGMRGWEDDIVATADSATQSLYYAFADALKNGEMLDAPTGRSAASDLLPQLLEKESLRELHGLLRRNLAAALQDEAQQALNALLNDDPYEQNQWMHNPAKYASYPEYLAKAIELLGEQHYMYKTLMAKKLFFKAKNMAGQEADWNTGSVENDSINQSIRNILETALSFDTNAAYLHYAIGNTWLRTFWGQGRDSFFYHQNQAIALSPTWVMPRLDIANFYLFNIVNPEWNTCEQYLREGLALKPDSYVLTERLAWLYQRMYRMDDAIALAHKMVLMRTDLSNGYATLGTTYKLLRQYEMAEEFAQKALSVDSTVWIWPLGILASTSSLKRDYEKAFGIDKALIAKGGIPWGLFTASLTFKSTKIKTAWNEYVWKKYSEARPIDKADKLRQQAEIHVLQKQWQKAKLLYHEAITEHTRADSTPYLEFIKDFSALAQIAAQQEQPDSAEYFFQKAINYYYPHVFGSWVGRLEFAEARYYYARFLLTQNRLADAEAQLLKAEEIDPRNPLNYYGMAALHAHQKHQKEALDWLAKALEWYYPDYDEIMAEPLFQKLRKTKRFKSLMRQYFPNGSDKPLVEKLAREYLPEIFNNQD